MEEIFEKEIFGNLSNYIVDNGSQNDPEINDFRIEEKLYNFLSSEIKFWNPDYILVIERKGTAILRALKECGKLDWPWIKTISSSTIEQYSSDFFQNKKLLIFDDMMMTGNHIKKTIKTLRKRFSVNQDQLRIIIFGIHENCSTQKLIIDDQEFYYPNNWYYRGLNKAGYQSIRKKILRFLETTGSLLLDTEHIEVRIFVDTSFNEFIGALNRSGKTVVYNAQKDRANVTIFYEDKNEVLKKRLDTKLPNGTAFDSLIKKCRVVQRGPKEFAIIPICYPSIPYNIGDWAENEHIRKLLGENLSHDNNSAFYGVGLIAALEVLKWTIKDLSASGFDKSKIKLPIISRNDNPKDNGYTLNHLKVMFPGIDLTYLNNLLTQDFSEAWKEGQKVKKIAKERNLPVSISDRQLYTLSIKLLQAIRDEIDTRNLIKLINGEMVNYPFGLSANEIFQMSRKLQLSQFNNWQSLPQEVVSSMFDVLIDESYLVTHVECKNFGNDLRYLRTFEPDGELISELVRNLTAVKGNPILINKISN